MSQGPKVPECPKVPVFFLLSSGQSPTKNACNQSSRIPLALVNTSGKLSLGQDAEIKLGVSAYYNLLIYHLRLKGLITVLKLPALTNIRYLLKYAQKGNIEKKRTHKGVWKTRLALATNSGSGFR